MTRPTDAQLADRYRPPLIAEAAAALRRPDDGEFGFCAECGAFIGTALMRCVDCAR